MRWKHDSHAGSTSGALRYVQQRKALYRESQELRAAVLLRSAIIRQECAGTFNSGDAWITVRCHSNELLIVFGRFRRFAGAFGGQRSAVQCIQAIRTRSEHGLKCAEGIREASGFNQHVSQ